MFYLGEVVGPVPPPVGFGVTEVAAEWVRGTGVFVTVCGAVVLTCGELAVAVG